MKKSIPMNTYPTDSFATKTELVNKIQKELCDSWAYLLVRSSNSNVTFKIEFYKDGQYTVLELIVFGNSQDKNVC